MGPNVATIKPTAIVMIHLPVVETVAKLGVFGGRRCSVGSLSQQDYSTDQTGTELTRQSNVAWDGFAQLRPNVMLSQVHSASVCKSEGAPQILEVFLPLARRIYLMRTASSVLMKPGGLPCLERTSSQSPVDPTTLTLLPFGMVATFRDEADGSSKTAVLRTVS